MTALRKPSAKGAAAIFGILRSLDFTREVRRRNRRTRHAEAGKLVASRLINHLFDTVLETFVHKNIRE